MAQDVRSATHPIITLSVKAETYLSSLASDLVLGRISYHQLPPSIRELWTYAYEEGCASRERAIVNLSAENDRLYLKAYNSPEKIREIYQRRLDVAFEAEAERLFGLVTI